MTTSKIPYRNIPGFPRLFLDYNEKSEFLESRFPGNNILSSDKNIESETELLEFAIKFDKRDNLIELINKSSSCFILNDIQQSNLELLAKDNTLCVVTGQQVGFLGGPLYTVFKAISAIDKAKKLSAKYPSLNFVPVFWVEDNDHDGFEAAIIYLLDKEHKIFKTNCCPECQKNDRTIVGNRVFSDNITEIIDEIVSKLPTTEYTPEVVALLKDIYKPGELWSAAFIKFTNYLLGETGLLFARGSDALSMGLFDKLANKELSQDISSYSRINEANDLLSANGFDIQAKNTTINLFHHSGKIREKVQTDELSGSMKIGESTYSREELTEMSVREIGSFSPNVLLRPVFQDSIIPNIAYVAGPAEIGYCAQIAEVYDFFGVRMPAFLPRHSLSVLDKKATRVLSKLQREIGFFHRNYQEILNEYTEAIKNDETESKISILYKELEDLFDELGSLAEAEDKSLIPSVQGAFLKSKQSIEVLHKKIISAQKRKHADTFAIIEFAANSLYPHSTLQERIFSPLNFLNSSGKTHFINTLIEAIRLNDNSEHIVVSL